MIKIIECPRDAMQGLKEFIPTEKKILYINQLLKVGFDTIDFGSFVSPKSIPQMRDTTEVLSQLNLTDKSSKLLAIVANKRGALDACTYQEIKYLGFPLSVSEVFQQRNTNRNITDALQEVDAIQELVQKSNKELVVYLSMAFGNPYGELYHEEVVAQLMEKLRKLSIKIVALSDTIGISEPKGIAALFSTLTQEYPKMEIGAHFHSTPNKWKEKIDTAYQNGCKRFDGAIKGFGGCPMAKEELVGNMPTEKLVTYFQKDLQLNIQEFQKSVELSTFVFIPK